jgi:hypothetical protein
LFAAVTVTRSIQLSELANPPRRVFTIDHAPRRLLSGRNREF